MIKPGAYSEQKAKDDGRGAALAESAFSRLILISLVGIMLCFICLTGLTWALFSHSITNEGNRVQTARFSAAVTVLNSEGVALTIGDMGYTLAAGGTYTVSITADGTASTGHCIIMLDGDCCMTDALASGDAVCFTVDCSAMETDVTLAISSRWGVSGEVLETVANGETIVPGGPGDDSNVPDIGAPGLIDPDDGMS